MTTRQVLNALCIVFAAFPVVAPGEWKGSAMRVEAGDANWGDEVVEYRLDGGDIVLSGNQPRAALNILEMEPDESLSVRFGDILAY